MVDPAGSALVGVMVWGQAHGTHGDHDVWESMVRVWLVKQRLTVL